MKKFLATILSVILLLTIIPMAYAEETNTYKVGDIVQFGSYPQSEVKDEALIAELNALAPKWEEWISYGYYSGNGNVGSMVQGDWMRYTDVSLNGEKYRGVKFTQYRPGSTYTMASAYSSQKRNGYLVDTVYWFSFDPINWRVLNPDTGFVMCESVIDSQPYSNLQYQDNGYGGIGHNFNNTSYTSYLNDYASSSIRKWLNDDFYNTAFNTKEKNEINASALDNRGFATLIGEDGYSEYDSASTTDRIFLLSFNEARNINFGFSGDYHYSDPARKVQGSDYAKCQGLDLLFLNWYLRSPGSYDYNCCLVDGTDGSCSGNRLLDCDTDNGIRPALKFVDISSIDKPSSDEPENTFGIMIDSDIYAVKVNGVESSRIFAIIDNSIDVEKVTAWDIFLTVDGVETQPDGKVTVRIPVPEGYDPNNCSVYYINPETGEVTDMSAYYEDGYFVFVTDHFSIYAVAELHKHSYVPAVTAPSCTEKGFTTYTCSCSDSYVADYVNAKGHKDDNGDYKCDNGCGYEFENSSENCSCNCHKSGFMGFIWKIINFFNKLFKSKEYCACGAKHW